MVVGLLQPVQSMFITTKVVSLNPAHGKVYSIQLYVIKFISDLQHVWFSLGTPDSPTNKTDCHDRTEILLIMVLNTFTLLLRDLSMLTID